MTYEFEYTTQGQRETATIFAETPREAVEHLLTQTRADQSSLEALYIIASDRYGGDGDIVTRPEFLALCKDAFGVEPELNGFSQLMDDEWFYVYQDEHKENVLVSVLPH